MDPTQDIFDFTTFPVLVGIENLIKPDRPGTRVYINGLAVALFNFYDVIEVALSAEILLTGYRCECGAKALCDDILTQISFLLDENNSKEDIIKWSRSEDFLAVCKSSTRLRAEEYQNLAARLRSVVLRVAELTEN